MIKSYIIYKVLLGNGLSSDLRWFLAKWLRCMGSGRVVGGKLSTSAPPVAH